MANDWGEDSPAPAIADPGDRAADLVRELLANMHRRDEAQKAGLGASENIRRLVALLREQNPQLIALLSERELKTDRDFATQPPQARALGR
jgi:hypothetical protein